ncbi:type II CRISPR-associated endonuclease Cas1 [Exiguobacterium sp. s55]|uniref:type II CRISPR-associated endonuclease Cas1 n=1 Tax=Exiguobacterium sp. s55 TaxID=2751245 RepID=UPI001BE80524|nr:type II CRISPR-associated endonuclease Cas1 [Exiguobacterium sp. s55]
MGFRNLIVTQESRLSSQQGYLVVTMPEGIHKVHLSELDAIVLENPRVKVSGVLLNQLGQHNISLILCDEKHHPSTMMLPLHGNFHRVKNINRQVSWNQDLKDQVWQKIIKHKLHMQIQVLKSFSQDNTHLLEYIQHIELGDATNREGLAAKVYFRKLFGPTFVRGAENPENWALNYGYAILASYFSRTIAAKGYLTELGIKHKNEFNAYNLAYDLMEPFRPLVDQRVKLIVKDVFTQKERHQLLDLVNEKVKINGTVQFLPNAVDLYCQSILNELNGKEKNAMTLHWSKERKG